MTTVGWFDKIGFFLKILSFMCLEMGNIFRKIIFSHIKSSQVLTINK